MRGVLAAARVELACVVVVLLPLLSASHAYLVPAWKGDAYGWDAARGCIDWNAYTFEESAARDLGPWNDGSVHAGDLLSVVVLGEICVRVIGIGQTQLSTGHSSDSCS